MGRAHGRLSAFPVSFLSRSVIEAFVRKYDLETARVDEVVIGNAVSAGTGQNFVRKALIEAGLPETTPGYSVGNVCASGLQAVFSARQAVLAGEAQVIVAAGAESISHMPEYIFKKQQEIKKIKGLTEGLMHDGLLCSITGRWMGALCEDMARREKITKKEQDDYAFGSYQKLETAYEVAALQEEIIPLKLTGDKIFLKDETFRKGVKRDVFDSFQSAFEYQGTITAGNSSAPCDGAAGMLLASSGAVQRYAFKPLARIAACVSMAANPKNVFELAPDAINACARKAGLPLQQIDLFEISEAFAAQMVFLQRKLPFLERKMNVFGGDIALGHPLGAAGIRGAVTLVHAMRQRRKRYGLACVCLGGGGALAMCLENQEWEA